MPTATTNLHYWFFTVFKERYESCGPDEDDVKQSMRDVVGIEKETCYTNTILLKEWCEEQMIDGGRFDKHNCFMTAILNSVDWLKLCLELREWVKDYDEQERKKDEEEEEEEETCYSCEETKTDNWYYNLTPKKNAPVCTDCRNREETCDCCDMKYPYYQIKHDGGGKYVCITCDNECSCHDSKCGTICPAISKIVDALATKA